MTPARVGEGWQETPLPPPGTEFNLRGEIMAKAEQKERVQMRRGIVGEDGQEWPVGSVQTASAPFARWLYQKGKAVPADEAAPTTEDAPEPEAPAAPEPEATPDIEPDTEAEPAADAEEEAAGEPEPAATPLPEDFPHRDLLAAAGIETLEAVPTTEDELVALEGIGVGRAKKILAALEG